MLPPADLATEEVTVSRRMMVAMAWSLLIKNGTVVDGSGGAPMAADVAVDGDRIAAVAPGLVGEAVHVIDAGGLVVAPGFIDIHSHSDFFYHRCPSAESKVRQGVTTEVVGMCSFSPAPVDPSRHGLMETLASTLGSELEIAWTGFGEYLDGLAARDLSVNVVHFVGHAPLRLAAMGADDRPPSTDDLTRMTALLGEALDAGAYGFSTGLVYAPSAFAETDELIALARAMSDRGGLYFSHIRGESGTLIEAIDEAIRIGEEGGVGLQIAHVKAAGRENWPKMDDALGRIDDARGRGLDVTADVYPYAASSTMMALLLPAWVHDGGIPRLLERLSDQDSRRRIIEECALVDDRWETPSGSAGWDEIMIATCPDPAWTGRTLAERARDRDRPGAEAMMDLLVEHEGAVSMVLFSQAEDNVKKALCHPFVMVGSDSIGLSSGPGPHAGSPHPRMYGTFPRVLGRYVRDEGLLTLEEAVAKMTGRPAAKLGLAGRGLVRNGCHADLAIFDAETVTDRATFEDPHQHPDGIPYVIVNGEVIVEGESYHAHAAGRVLRRG